MKTEEKVYTISDVADELGISKTTVSRAISGKGRISRQTRERVLEFIKLHDYQPNVLAKGLAQSRTFNLALVLPADFGGSEISFFQECMHGICEMSASYNYDVVVVIIETGDLTQLRRIVANRKVDGVILSRSVTGSAVQEFLLEKKVPFVVVGYVERPGIHWVDNRNQEASRELTGIMLMKGIHRIALFEGHSGFQVTQSRREGFLEAHQDLGIPADKSLIFSDVETYLKAVKAVEAALEAGADGILCMDDYITNMVLGCLREKRIQVPSQIKLASFYDSLQLEKNEPPVTSLHFDTRALGKNACLDLLAQLGETIGQEKFPMNYQVILRESTK